MLEPILIAGYGRSGTTALMSLLATAREIFFERVYPFEVRHLSYHAKLSSILSGRPFDTRFTPEHLYAFEDSLFGPEPWGLTNVGAFENWLPVSWTAFSKLIRDSHSGARLYAEKAPVWLAPYVSQFLSCHLVYLFRDPRDVFLSANAFMKAKSYYGFHRMPGETDLDHARNLTAELLTYFENFAWDNYRKKEFLLVRYEDFVSDTTPFLDWVQSLGATPRVADRFDYLAQHSTSPSLSASVERWREEGLTQEVRRFFERHMGGEMRALGYAIDTNDLCPSLDFRKGILPPLTNPAHGHIETNCFCTTVSLCGHDFGFLLPWNSLPAATIKEIWVSLAGGAGDHCSVYWSSGSAGFSEERCIHVPYVPGAHWRVLRFRVASHPLWVGQIDQIRIDVFNSSSPPLTGAGHVRWVRFIS